MASFPTVPTIFLIISDTHNFTFNENGGQPQLLRLPTPKTDVLLHCGDLTQVGGIPSFKKALEMLGSIEAELKLVIAGNHDLELNESYWDAQCCDYDGDPEDPRDHDAAVDVMRGSLARESGVLFLDEGTHSFTLRSGASFTIYVSPYTPAFCDWAFADERHEDRFNTSDQVAEGVASIAKNLILGEVDIIMTHGPPYGVLDQCPNGNVGCENLLRAVRRVKPMMHCFGHVHEGNGGVVMDWRRESAGDKQREEIGNPYPESLVWKERKGERTLAVNAAIMTAGYEPTQKPWLVSLDLHQAS